MVKVTFLPANRNSVFTTFSQFVSSADVSQPVALLFEDYRNGQKTLGEALDQLAALSSKHRTTSPFSVYVNISTGNHASVYFMQTDLVNRSQDTDLEESKKLGKMDRGLKVYFRPNSLQVVNQQKIKRIDLYTEDGREYKVDMSGQFLKPGFYTFFKCYEVIGISDEDIEWAYLMAAKDWCDVTTNNSVSFSKRIMRELHKQILDGDELSAEELRMLNKLNISSSMESVFSGLLDSVASPRVLPWFILISVVLVVAIYVELRLKL